MNLLQYLVHYLNPSSAILMVLTAAACILACVGLIRVFTGNKKPAVRQGITEQFYELIFSATMILLFVGTYFLIDFLGYGDQNPLWIEYSDFILLGFILGSVIMNSVLDNFLIPLKNMKPGARSTMRLLGMLYMLIVFAYIKFIYQNDNYDNIIFYFLTLVIGRFVYFDASVEGFASAISDAIRALPLLVLALACSGVIAYVGFSSGYLLIANGVVFNLFVGHLYLLLVIFVVHWISLFVNFIRSRTARKEEVYYDDEEEYADDIPSRPTSYEASYSYEYEDEYDSRNGGRYSSRYNARYADDYDERYDDPYTDDYDDRYADDYERHKR